MPIFELTEEIVFPHPNYAEDDGLLAIGGDLSAERLLLAYSNAIFPWFTNDKQILWWSPNPRMVLFTEKFKPAKSLLQTIRKQKFEIRFDTNFEAVIKNCASVKRPDELGTWITKKMKNAYIQLHKLGFAHSVETYQNNQLVGGLYGVSIGAAFFGESMFHKVTDASKVAFYSLVKCCKQLNIKIIDAQQTTTHLKSLGAEEISREEFLQILETTNNEETFRGSWENCKNFL